MRFKLRVTLLEFINWVAVSRASLFFFFFLNLVVNYIFFLFLLHFFRLLLWNDFKTSCEIIQRKVCKFFWTKSVRYDLGDDSCKFSFWVVCHLSESEFINFIIIITFVIPVYNPKRLHLCIHRSLVETMTVISTSTWKRFIGIIISIFILFYLVNAQANV